MGDDDKNLPGKISSGFAKTLDFGGLTDEEGDELGESAGFALQREMAHQAQREGDKNKKAGFKKASRGNENGFTLAGKDGGGGGFALPLDSPGLLGKKWSAFHKLWYRNDQYAQYFAPQLNRRFDRIIKRALENNWTHVGLQFGVITKVDADPVLVRAFNRRLQELSMDNKQSNLALKAMGFHPERVRDQIRNMTGHGGHIDDVMEALNPPPGPPTGATPQPT